MQGGIHPEFTGETYLDICRAVRAAAPGMHVHAFSPLEVHQGAATLGLPVEEFLARLKQAGLGTLPGTAAEVWTTKCARCCARTRSTRSAGCKSCARLIASDLRRPRPSCTVTSMVTCTGRGILLRLRELQNETGGFTEFVPLPFVHMEAPIYLKGRARRGPTFREAVLMHAVARLALHPVIANVQTSWVKMGPEGVKVCLRAGANDLGGTLMDETITRSAGAVHGQEMTPTEMEQIIRSVGRIPRQRRTTYEAVSEERYRASLSSAKRVGGGYWLTCALPDELLLF